MSGELEAERDRLRGELSRARAQLMALESVMAQSEHLVLKAPALAIWDGYERSVPQWRGPMPERWHVRVEIEREALTGEHAHHRFVDRMDKWIHRVDVFDEPRILFAALPPPRRI